METSVLVAAIAAVGQVVTALISRFVPSRNPQPLKPKRKRRSRKKADYYPNIDMKERKVSKDD